MPAGAQRMVSKWKVECVYEHMDETVTVGVVYVSLRGGVSKARWLLAWL